MNQKEPIVLHSLPGPPSALPDAPLSGKLCVPMKA